MLESPGPGDSKAVESVKKAPGSVRRGRLAAEKALAASRQALAISLLSGERGETDEAGCQTSRPTTPNRANIPPSITRAHALATELQNRPLPLELDQHLRSCDSLKEPGDPSFAAEGTPRGWQDASVRSFSDTCTTGLDRRKMTAEVTRKKKAGSVRHALDTIHERREPWVESGIASAESVLPSVGRDHHQGWFGNYTYVSAGPALQGRNVVPSGSEGTSGQDTKQEHVSPAKVYVRRRASFWRRLCGRHPLDQNPKLKAAG